VRFAYFVTTPIYYANAEPHIGHTFTTILADTLVRWQRLHGRDAFSVSGTDEHGEKMVEAAANAGLPPLTFTTGVAETFQRTWAALGIAPSRFVRTTEPAHVRNVQAVLQRVYDAGWIEKRDYEGLYCVGCERFLTERDVVDGRCPDHDRVPETRREANYFFLMSREFAWLRERIEKNPGWIRPERYAAEALGMLRDEAGLGDLSISRPKSRLDWGVELPFDREHVCYVWFDALLSYLTGAGYDGTRSYAEQSAEFRARWESAEHLIAKDILKPHAIFWPTMLKAMGFPPFRHLSVHGYWTVDERKISKSLGHRISPLDMHARYGFESFRYYLLREMSFGLDASFDEGAMVERVNADLANNLGNLVSRTLNLVEKLCGGRVPEPAPGAAPLAGEFATARNGVDRAMASLRFHDAIATVMALAGAANRYLDGEAPWKAAKQPGGAAAVRTSLYGTCEALRQLGVMLFPFLPGKATELLRRLGRDAPGDGSWESFAREPLAPGTPVEKGAPLFPRLEAPAA
jgi:methionyl-tRNA synthetase